MMVMKIFKKISKIFVALLCFFIVLGFLMLIVRDYSTPIVNTVEAKTGKVTKTFNYRGTVVAKDSIEIIAPEKLYVNKANVLSSQIVYPGNPVLYFDAEKLSDTIKGDFPVNNDAKFMINNYGEFKINEHIYVEYINDKDVIEEGEVIIKYSINEVENLHIVAQIDEDTITPLPNRDIKIYYYKNYYSERVVTEITNTTDFTDYNLANFSLNKNSKEKIRVNNTVNIIVEVVEGYYESVVPITALIPKGEIRENSSCYVYCLVEEDTLLGKETRVLLREAYVYSIGNTKAAIRINNDDNKITDFSNIKIVNYATAAIKDGTRVRVK